MASPRQWFRNLSLARKLTAIGVATSTASLVIACAVIVAYDVTSSRQRLGRDTGLLADVVAANSTAALAFGDAAGANETLRAVAVNEHIVSAAILLRDGALFAQYHRDRGAPRGAPAADPEALRRGDPWQAFTSDGLLLSRPVMLENDRIGTVVLKSDVSEIVARAIRFGRTIALVLVGAVGIALLVGSRLQRVISTPLLHLTAVTRTVTQNHRYDVRVEKTGGDEIGELINGFNEMLGEIQARDRELVQHRDELERIVDGRTAELRAANTDLVAARDKAMEASRAKSDFLANMSHEIRTPMNGIIGMTELALDSDPSDQQRDYLTTVKSSADSLLAILNDILDFSKIESRKLELEAIAFAVREMVGQSLKPLVVKADQKGLQLRHEIHAGVPEGVVGDPVRIRQVLSNLVGNAIKFTEAGHVLVTVREDSHTDRGTVLHFEVADTGIGIPRDKHETIFDAFSQADGSTTRRFGGTGLGLTISATLVQMMGGRIWVESEPGRGSTFHFTATFDTTRLGERGDTHVPHEARARTAESARLAARHPAQGHPGRLGRSLRVLLAEDNIVNQRVAVGLLTRRGHRVTVADNGLQALAALDCQRFDLVLMDVQMPDMGGYEATAEIRRREAAHGGHLRIIAMTAHAMSGDRDRCLTAGMDAYLSKPINAAALFEIVERETPAVASTNAPSAPETRAVAASIDRKAC